MGKALHLNSVVNRFQLNKKHSVGDLNEMISTAMPLTEAEWASYYFQHGKSESVLSSLAATAYEKIQEIVIPEIESITIEDCERYLKDLVITKTFEGMRTRFNILNAQLLKGTGKEFSYLPDHKEDWRFKTYKIDYYSTDTERELIGIKVAPISLLTSPNPTVIRARKEIEETHRIEVDRGAGYFFILFYSGSGINIQIENAEIIEKIKNL